MYASDDQGQTREAAGSPLEEFELPLKERLGNGCLAAVISLVCGAILSLIFPLLALLLIPVALIMGIAFALGKGTAFRGICP